MLSLFQGNPPTEQVRHSTVFSVQNAPFSPDDRSCGSERILCGGFFVRRGVTVSSHSKLDKISKSISSPCESPSDPLPEELEEMSTGRSEEEMRSVVCSIVPLSSLELDAKSEIILSKRSTRLVVLSEREGDNATAESMIFLAVRRISTSGRG
jgi:hypothetical protein